jgi:hypothetical protein
MMAVLWSGFGLDVRSVEEEAPKRKGNETLQLQLWTAPAPAQNHPPWIQIRHDELRPRLQCWRSNMDAGVNQTGRTAVIWRCLKVAI